MPVALHLSLPPHFFSVSHRTPFMDERKTPDDAYDVPPLIGGLMNARKRARWTGSRILLIDTWKYSIHWQLCPHYLSSSFWVLTFNPFHSLTIYIILPLITLPPPPATVTASHLKASDSLPPPISSTVGVTLAYDNGGLHPQTYFFLYI